MQSIVIVNISMFTARWFSLIKQQLIDYRLGLEFAEKLYDYCVVKAFELAMESEIARNKIRIDYQHDVFELIFFDLQSEMVPQLRSVIESNGLIFHNFHRLKFLVTYDSLIIVRSTHTGYQG